MSSLTLKVTDAGRAAIVNAQNTGTAPVLVSQIGVTDQAFVADATTAALPGELKRLATFAGAAVAADTIHVTIRDDTADVYSCRGFAMYLDDGTLFASYGQADPIGEKSAQSMFLLALDAIFTDIDATALTFGDTNFLLSQATTEQQGIIELATEAEAEAGADATRAMTPATHKGALDARFGAGAPSGFVKSLLTAATALAFRTALAIKGAALYDTGTGNGLDADLLDGQHGSYYRAWANLTGVPVSFPPSAHTHAWADITGVPVYATRWPTWDEVTTKPATFPPSPHSHAWDNINNPPETATRWPAWGEVTNKPTTLAAFSSQDGAKLASAVQPNTSPVLNSVYLGDNSDGNAALIYRSGDNAWIRVNGGAQYLGLYADGHLTYSGKNIAKDGDSPTFVGTVTITGGSGAGGGHLDLGGGSDYKIRMASRRFLHASDANWGFWNDEASTWDMQINQTSSDVTFRSKVTATSYDSAASSRTVKHDIAPCRYGLAEFMRIPWVEYRYNKSVTNDDRLRFGSIVEDVEPIAPELVIHRKDQVPTFEYDQFIPVIGRALQQYIARADARADKAKARADGLEQLLQALADRVALLEAH